MAVVLREPALEAAIVASPDDRAPYEVGGDWLAQRGDPRGEFIPVQLALELRPDDAALVARDKELRAAHEAEWTDNLTAGVSYASRQTRASWRRGFIDHVEIGDAYESNDSTLAWTDVARLATAIALRSATIGSLILEHAKRFARLDALDLSENYPPRDVARDLEAALPRTRSGDPKTADEYGRYVSVGE